MSGIDQWTENIPKLPIPSVETTLERYLAGLEAVIPRQQLELTKQTVQDFLQSGEANRLQELLTKYDNGCENWATNFWLEDMYLRNPLPLLVNSNPFFLLPKQTFKTLADQIHFAAIIVHFALDYRLKIHSEQLTQDSNKISKFCMQTYRHFFTACRIPGVEQDRLILSDPSQHFIVAAFNQFTVVQLDCFSHKPSVECLEQSLMHIWNESKKRKISPNIGILTADNRRLWANIRNELIQDQTNANSIKCLESSLFILCLDDLKLTKFGSGSACNSLQMAKMEPNYMGSMLLHGGGSALHTCNRWYDKFLQIIVSKEGICGILAEHSASEGVTVMNFCETFLSYYQNYSKTRNEITAAQTLNCQPLQWNIDMKILNEIRRVKNHSDRLIADVDFHVLQFQEYGKDFIKKQKISPDAFIQLALQLTYFKLKKCLASSYESCSLRAFRKGRVDTIRSCTKEALDWTKSMCSGEQTDEEKIKLFQKAIEKQSQVMKYTISGSAPDNHLVALREISKMHFNTIPQMFKEKSYQEYINFILSTSQVYSEKNVLVGYGPVVPNGYGCSYNPKETSITFCITSFYSSDDTSSDFFAFSLEGSLLKMREICEKIQTQQG